VIKYPIDRIKDGKILDNEMLDNLIQIMPIANILNND
jgi:hypothetical protein